jgi:DNA-binding transcriptional LysR family regulator
MDLLNLHQLYIFQIVAEERAISRAAERLYLTQPAVSQQVHALEIAVGATLFTRGRRGVLLTPAGETLAEYAQRILDLAAEARQAVALTTGARAGVVRLGASPGVGPCLMPTWISVFRTQHPSISVTMKTASTPEILKTLHERKIDLAIVEGEIHDPELQVEHLTDEEILVVVGPGHAWWGRTSITPAELGGERFIMREEGSLTRAWATRALLNLGVRPAVIAEFDNPIAIKRAVTSGMGIALLPHFAVKGESERERLAIIAIEGRPLYRTVKLVWASHCLQNSAVYAFIRYLTQEFPHITAPTLDPESSV